MRASRLLSIQMLLETRGRMAAPELAEALEVSVRTLYRDIDELTAAGVPVYAERGRAGGFQLLPGWKTTLTGLTSAETEAVFLSGLAGPAGDLGLGPQVKSAQLKLLSALPAQSRGQAHRISSRLHLDPVEWYRETDDLPHLAAVAAAVWEEKQLAIVYESWTRTARQVVHPLGLVLKGGVWYLVAARDARVRTFRISNIRDAEVLETSCVRPRRFDLARHWAESVCQFEAALNTSEATVAMTARGLLELRQLNSAIGKALRAVSAPPRGERVQARIPIESISQAAGVMLRLAPEVEVLRPKELRRAVLERARGVAVMYAR